MNDPTGGDLLIAVGSTGPAAAFVLIVNDVWLAKFPTAGNLIPDDDGTTTEMLVPLLTISVATNASVLLGMMMSVRVWSVDTLYKVIVSLPLQYVRQCAFVDESNVRCKAPPKAGKLTKMYSPMRMSICATHDNCMWRETCTLGGVNCKWGECRKVPTAGDLEIALRGMSSTLLINVTSNKT